MEIIQDRQIPWGEDAIYYILLTGEVGEQDLLPEEAALVKERHHPRRQRRYCQGRLGIQEALRRGGYKEVVGTPVLMDERGTPFWGSEEKPDVSLSIAHQGSSTLVAVAPKVVSVGVDIEQVDPRFERPLDTIATSVERRFLDKLGPEGSTERVWGATAVWIAKEALAKGTGRGWMAHQQDFPLVDLEIEGKSFRCRFKNKVLWRVHVEEKDNLLMAFAGIRR